MNIVFLGGYDWANTSNRVARAINRVGNGVSARVVSVQPHPFGYLEDIVISRDGPAAVGNLVQNADWIVGIGDADYDRFAMLCETHGARRTAKYAIRHSGTRLRDYPRECAAADAAFRVRFVPMDLYGPTAHQRTRPFVQPQEGIRDAVVPSSGKLRVCHIPSERRTKGTKWVMRAMERAPSVDFRFWERLPYHEARSRRASCHVYVDQLHPGYGNFGAASCEAMADGVAVVANMSKVRDNPWIKAPPIVDARTPDDLERVIKMLASDRARLLDVRQRSLEWAHTYLSDEFTHAHWREALTI